MFNNANAVVVLYNIGNILIYWENPLHVIKTIWWWYYTPWDNKHVLEIFLYFIVVANPFIYNNTGFLVDLSMWSV